MLAAHLAPQDPEEWARLADMSLEMDDRQQAAACYKKGTRRESYGRTGGHIIPHRFPPAIDADIENVRFHHARCGLLEEIGDARSALRGYRRLLASEFGVVFLA